jgi:hypothetical protein
MKKIILWYSIQNVGDGSAVISWFLSKKQAEEFDEDECDRGYGYSESAVGSVETFEGSNIHKEAIKTQKNMEEERTERKREGEKWDASQKVNLWPQDE